MVNSQYGVLVTPRMDGPVPEPGEGLLFHTGFGGNVRTTRSGDEGQLLGADTALSAPNDWQDLKNDPRVRDIYMGFAGQTDPAQQRATVIDDPTRPGSGNRVLHMFNRDSVNPFGYWSRVNMYMEVQDYGFQQLYWRYQSYYHEDFRLVLDVVREVGRQWWTSEFGLRLSDPGFSRIYHSLGVTIGCDGNQHFWHTNQRFHDRSIDPVPPQTYVWSVNNKSIPVPIGQWYTSEAYVRYGDPGRFFFAITPQGQSRRVVFDIRDKPITGEGGGLSRFNLGGLYCGPEWVDGVRARGGAIQQYMDDLAIWDRIPPGVSI